MKLAEVKALDNRIEAGAWVGDLPYFPGLFLKVRSIESSTYIRLNAKLRPPLKEGEPERTEEENTEIQKRLLREALLLDWHGIDEECSPENAAAAIEIGTFRACVWFAATFAAQRGKDEIEVLEKNSSAASDGQSSGATTEPATPPSKPKA